MAECPFGSAAAEIVSASWSCAHDCPREAAATPVYYNCVWAMGINSLLAGRYSLTV